MLKQVRLGRGKRRGFTLTEVAIVLGIIGLILGAIWAAASAVYNNLRVSKAQQELIQISQAVRAMYASQPILDTSITSANDGPLVTAGIFPADMISGGVPYDPWGGVATVDFSQIVLATKGDGFVITFPSIPQQPCVDMLTAISNNADNTMTGVSSTANKVNIAGVLVDLPSAATIDGFCPTTTPAGNSIAFTYRLR